MKPLALFCLFVVLGFDTIEAQKLGTTINKQGTKALGHKQAEISPKQDEPHNPPPTPDVHFDIIDGNGAVVACETSSNAKATFSNLPDGSFTIVATFTDSKKLLFDQTLKPITNQASHVDGSGTSKHRKSADALKPIKISVAFIIDAGVIVMGGDRGLHTADQALALVRRRKMANTTVLELVRDGSTLNIVVQGG